MAETGLLSESVRVEFIDGEIVEMAAIGWRHANCVNDLTMLLALRRRPHRLKEVPTHGQSSRVSFVRAVPRPPRRLPRP